jgi:hypothetical protein
MEICPAGDELFADGRTDVRKLVDFHHFASAHKQFNLTFIGVNIPCTQLNATPRNLCVGGGMPPHILNLTLNVSGQFHAPLAISSRQELNEHTA